MTGVPDVIRRRCEDRSLALALLVRSGSRSYGLEGPESDEDYAGIFVPTLRSFVSLDGPGAETETGDDPDFALHEIGKFCRLALKGNPALLETLWNDDVVVVDTWGRELRDRRKAFLHKDGLGVYVAYAEAQMKKMVRGGKGLHTSGGTWNGKFGMHLIRLLHAGIRLGSTGEVMVRVPPELLPPLLEIRSGAVPMERVLALAVPLLEQLRRLAAGNALPERPDAEAVDDLVARARLSRT